MTDSEHPAGLLVLGLGNILCGDDGLGIAAVELFRRRYVVAENVRLVDGGTLGLSLLSCFGDCDDAILVDAIRLDGPAGSLVRLEGEDVAPAMRTRLSVHQIGVADLLDALRWLDASPRRLILLGLVPRNLEFASSRSPDVERRIPGLVEAIAAEARAMGYTLHPTRDHEAAAAGSGDPAVHALGL
jgi:hydrogenase maturation protease